MKTWSDCKKQHDNGPRGPTGYEGPCEIQGANPDKGPSSLNTEIMYLSFLLCAFLHYDLGKFFIRMIS